MLHVPSVLSQGSGLSESHNHTPANHPSPDKAGNGNNNNSATPSGSITPGALVRSNPNNTNNSQFPSDSTTATTRPPNQPVFNTYNSDDDEDDGIAAKRKRNAERQRQQEISAGNKKNSLYNYSAGSIDSFDMLDHVPQSLHALCVGMNRDCSRIFAGHDCGLTIWNIMTPLPPVDGIDDQLTDQLMMIGNNNTNSSSMSTADSVASKKTPHRTITLARMYGKTWVEMGGKGFVFCASVLNRTDYAVCGAKTKVKDVESEELFVLQGNEVRHKLMNRIAADGGKCLRDVHIEQDRIFALCATSFHLFDLSGARPLLTLKSCAPIPSVGNAGFFATSTAAIQSAVTKTVGKAMGIVGSLWGSWGGGGGSANSANQQQQQQSAQESPANNEQISPPGSGLDSARGSNNTGSNAPSLSGPSSNATAVFTAPNSDRPSHVQEHTSVLSVLSGADEDTMSVCAIPSANNAGSFSVVDWKKLQVIKSSVPAHQGHLAVIKITMGSGSVKLLAVTASTTGTTCRVWNALNGQKLRNLRMTHMGPGGAAPSTFKLRGVEMDRFGRVVVLCQDGKTSTPSIFSNENMNKASSPQTSIANLNDENTNDNNNNSYFNFNSTSSSSATTHNALEALFFDIDIPDDGLAPVAGEHYNLENTSFASRAVTAGVGMVAGKKVAEAKDAIRPLSRIVMPLRPTSTNSSSVSTSVNLAKTGDKQQQRSVSNTNVNVMMPTRNVFNQDDDDDDDDSPIKYKTTKSTKEPTTTTQNPTSSIPLSSTAFPAPNQQYNIEELISIIMLTGDPKKLKYCVTPDSTPIVVSRIHSSGIKSIAQVTFGGLPREDLNNNASAFDEKNPNNNKDNNNNTEPSSATSKSNDNNTNEPTSATTTSRMGADIRDAKMKTGTARLDVIKLF